MAKVHPRKIIFEKSDRSICYGCNGLDPPLRCPVESCFRSTLMSSLRSHMRRKHRHEVEFEKDLSDHTQEVDDCDIACEDASQTDCNKDKMDGRDISVKEMALFALKMQEFNRLSDTATYTILENTCQLLEQNKEHLKAQVKACIEKTGFDLKDIEGLEELLKL